jgi:HlyD family secretion protein
VDRREGVLRVPTEAVGPDDTLLVLNETDGLLHEKEIATGLSNWEQTEVTGGLSRGELVVLSLDAEGVQDGAAAIRDETEEQ